MFKKPRANFAYIFPFPKPRHLIITMMFVFFPIDILFIRDGRVVEVARKVKPFGSYVPKQIADTFIELPVGKATKNMIGKKIIWNSKIVEMVDE